MIRATPTRLATAVLSAALAGTLPVTATRAQTVQNVLPKPSATIPATPPTSPPQNSVPAVTPPVAQRVDVQLIDGKISVDVSNAGLNQVLHEVGSKAGIKITGSVNEERVFGHYGPSAPAVILAALLDGTGSNMLLVDDPKGASELILTPRRGSPTPPNPNAAQEANNEESEPATRYIPPIRPYQPPTAGRGPLSQGPNQPAAQTEPNQTGGEPGSTQQIYNQLQRNAQQNSQQNTPQAQPQD